MTIHIVKPGDTINSVAVEYGVPEFVIRNLNNLAGTNAFVTGQALLILVPRRLHTVRAEDTLFSIAQEYGTTVNALYRNNPNLRGNDTIFAGQTLVISYEQRRESEIDVFGYAYPYINQTLLRTTLPYLSFTVPFTYGIKEDGTLVMLDDEKLIGLSLDYGILPYMHLSTLTEDGGFSNELASLVLNNEEIQSRLAEEILLNMRAKGYRGLDIDFEFVFEEDALKYADFIRRMRDLLNPEGYEVIAALAPKTSAEQEGLLYRGHNYRAIGEAANATLLMTYEWGYTYGAPMAVAPINNVRRVVDYALTEIPAHKIFLGIPNYGYDWTLPYVRGESRARSIGNVEALNIAYEHGAEISYDTNAQSPFFRYFDENGAEHEVWFEDVRSIRKKLELIAEKSLRGAGYWNLMRPFQQNWSLLDYMFDVNV